MRAVRICGGSISDYKFTKGLIEPTDTIICADSGYNHAAKMGLCVDILIGDFDSIGEMPEGIDAIRYPHKKDQTDTEIAISYARGKGFKDFLLLGATGSRIDHTLTNIFMLKGFLERGESAVIVDAHNKIMLTDSEIVLNEPKGSIVSLLPLTTCLNVSSSGLEYPLNSATLLVGKGLSISNIMACESASVSLEKGLLLVVVARD